MPTPSDLHVDRALSNISIEFRNAQDSYVAEMVLPKVPVKLESDKYYEYDKGNRFQIPSIKRAPKSSFKRGDWTVTTQTYTAEEYGWEELIDDRERDNADDPIAPDRDSTEVATDIVLIAYEQRVVDLVTATANITQNATLSGTSQWSDFANSDPFTDVRTGIDTIQKATGVRPNALAMGYEVWNKLQDHPDLLERVKYTQRGLITPEIVAAAFDLEEVHVSRALKNTAKEGQTVSLGYMWGKDVLLYFKQRTPGIKRVSLGYTFQKRDLQVERYREEPRKSDVVRVTHLVDEKLVVVACGYLIKAAVA